VASLDMGSLGLLARSAERARLGGVSETAVGTVVTLILQEENADLGTVLPGGVSETAVGTVVTLILQVENADLGTVLPGGSGCRSRGVSVGPISGVVCPRHGCGGRC
jgi:hypothetical protein